MKTQLSLPNSYNLLTTGADLTVPFDPVYVVT